MPGASYSISGLAMSVVRPVLQNFIRTAFARIGVPEPAGSPARATSAAFAVARSPFGTKMSGAVWLALALLPSVDVESWKGAHEVAVGSSFQQISLNWLS